MSPVGHILVGVCIGALGIRQNLSLQAKVATLGSLVFAANLPDCPIPNWGHDRYDISHSIFVTGLLICLIGLAWRFLRHENWIKERRLFLLLSSAWLSHLLLDTMYNHGHGLKMFWPVSNASLALPIKWFDTLKSPIYQLTPQNLSVFTNELIAYGTLLAVVLIGRPFYRWNRPNDFK